MILINEIVTAILSVVDKLGYVGIFIAMIIESSFVPFPSELILIPAGALIKLNQMSFPLVLSLAVLGSLLGAEINYQIGYRLGRKGVNKLIKKYGKIFLLNENKIQKADKFFEKNGKITTFIGRLIPAIRQLISLPAGFTKMKKNEFWTFTALGAGLWSLVLIYLGYFFQGNIALIKRNENIILIILLGLTIIIFAITKYLKLRKNKIKIKNNKTIALKN